MIKFLLLSLICTSAALATDFPDNRQKASMIKSDSGIRGPSYTKIMEELKDIESNYPSISQYIVYGTSVGGRPLSIIKIAKKKVTSTLPAIYIGGSIHGDEYLNIEDRLPRWFVEQSKKSGPIATYLDRGGAIYVAPILNPDGYDRRRRKNNIAGVEGFKQPETNLLVSFLAEDLEKSQRKLEVALDYHCCIGALLYPWSFTGPVLPQVDKERHLDIAKTMQKFMGTAVKYGVTPDILGYSAH